MEIDIDHALDSVERKVAQTGAQAGERIDRVGPISGTAATGDGAVSVTVAPGGLLTEVTLKPAALNAGADALAAQIMALAERATRRAGASMHQALAPVLGPAGEKHLASLGYQPDDEDEPDEGFDRPVLRRRGER